MTQHAVIAGEVQYREGDGSNIVIRPGPCEIEETELDVTISWQDGDTRDVASMPVDDYRRYLSTGAIRLVEDTAA